MICEICKKEFEPATIKLAGYEYPIADTIHIRRHVGNETGVLMHAVCNECSAKVMNYVLGLVEDEEPLDHAKQLMAVYMKGE